MQLGKQKYLGTMLIPTLLVDISKATNPGAQFTVIGADWR